VAAPTTGASGAVAVPTGLRGRTSGLEHAITAVTGVPGRAKDKPETPRLRDGAESAESLDAEAFEAESAGTGMVTSRSPRA
jgi:hypothetical protein